MSSRATWVKGKEASIFVSAIDKIYMLPFVICLKSLNVFLNKLILRQTTIVLELLFVGKLDNTLSISLFFVKV